MLSLAPIIQLLTPKPVGFQYKWFRKVAGAAEYAYAIEEALPLPMAWVIRIDEASTSTGEAVEDETIRFDVVIAIENVRTMEVGKTDDMLLSYRRAVRKLLLGHQLQDDNALYIKPVQRNGGKIITYEKGGLFWRDHYLFDATEVNYQPDPVISQNIFEINKTL